VYDEWTITMIWPNGDRVEIDSAQHPARAVVAALLDHGDEGYALVLVSLYASAWSCKAGYTPWFWFPSDTRWLCGFPDNYDVHRIKCLAEELASINLDFRTGKRTETEPLITLGERKVRDSGRLRRDAVSVRFADCLRYSR